MPLIMIVAVGGIGLYALNKWNPAAAETTPATTTTTTTTEDTSKSCSERKGEDCRCGTCRNGDGCDGEINGDTSENGKCLCTCKGSGGGGDGDGDGGSRQYKQKSTQMHHDFVKRINSDNTNTSCKCLVPNCSCHSKNSYARAYLGYGGSGSQVGVGGMHYVRTRSTDVAANVLAGEAGEEYPVYAYRTRSPRITVPSIRSRMLVEVPNDNWDNFESVYPRTYFTYEADQPEYSIANTTPARAYAVYNESTGFDEQQNTMPFVRMYDTVRKVPLRFAGYTD